MNFKRIIIVYSGLLIIMLTGCHDDQKPCTRESLTGFIDKYLEALVAHTPASLPLADDVRYTENGQTLEPGDGMWGPANAVRDYKLYFIDTTSCQAGIFCVIEENGHPEIAALRLKIENDRISEIENIIARSGQNVWNRPDSLKAQPIFTETLKPEERRSREEMIAIADSYFEGLEQSTDSLTPFAENCTRIENGNITANNPHGENPINRMTAGEQFATGFSTFITNIRERRYPIVDENKGLVYAIIFFDHAGIITEVTMKNGISFRVPPPYDTPYCFLIGELFKIKDGKIHQIEAVLIEVPYGMPSGWGN
jgi:hypothetical protein